jgi:GntR family transcriptional regulator
MESRTESNGESNTSRAQSPKGARRLAAGRSEPPLYIQVARTLKEEIVNGAHPVGSRLPTEDGLCERFSVSRYTVREALRLLRNDGLVSSRQGAGTIVTLPGSARTDTQQFMSINDLVAFGTDTRLVIESIRTVNIAEKLASRTDLPEGEEWLQVRGYRHSTGADTPFCWTEIYINRAFAAVGRLLQRHTGPIFPLIEDLFGESIIEVNQQISATVISAELSGVLKVKTDSAALQVRRTYKTSDGRIAQVTFNTHPAARFEHAMTLRRVKA